MHTEKITLTDKQTNRQTDRIEWIDIAKGIAILCIIAGHMGINAVNRIVFTFHVPIFFLISGYFLSFLSDFKSYFKKCVKRLVLPYLFTSFLLIIAKGCIDIVKGRMESVLSDIGTVFVQALYGSGSNDNKTFGNIQQIGAIWFLLALLWALLLVKLVINKRYGFLIVTAVAIVSYISSRYFWLPWDIQAGGTAAVFVYLGAYYKKKNCKFDIKWWLVIIGSIALVLEYISDVNVSIVRNYYKYTIVSIIGALLISYVVLCISKGMESIVFVKKLLCFFGKNSIIVLCFHLVELNNVPWHIIHTLLSGVPLWIRCFVIFAGKIIFVSSCTAIVLKVNGLRKIFSR